MTRATLNLKYEKNERDCDEQAKSRVAERYPARLLSANFCKNKQKAAGAGAGAGAGFDQSDLRSSAADSRFAHSLRCTPVLTNSDQSQSVFSPPVGSRGSV